MREQAIFQLKDAVMENVINVASSLFITLRFTFADKRYVPKFFPELPYESHQEEEKLIDSIPNVDLKPLKATLTGSQRKFDLIEAFYQTHVKGYRHRRIHTYRLVSFVFVRREHALFPPAFKERRLLVLDSLHEMCKAAIWQVRGTRDVLDIEAGDTDEHSVYLDFDNRTARFDRYGKLTLQRSIKKKGALVPTEPEYYLDFKGDTIKLNRPSHKRKSAG